MSSKTNTLGAIERAKLVLHSIHTWFEGLFVFTDSSVADEIIESMHAIRHADRKNREVSKA